jgi:hypothetical protein
MKAQTVSQSPSRSESFADVIHGVDAVIPTIILSDPGHRSLMAVSPQLQGRVFSSSTDGWNGRSLGWVDRKFIDSKQVREHYNPYGGEDRVWIAPEGGQFSIFFAPNAPFDLAHWSTPGPIDTQPFEIVDRSPTSVRFRKSFSLQNRSGAKFNVRVDRRVKLLSAAQIWKDLNVKPLDHVKMVGFESMNTLTNTGHATWEKKSGLLSIWILGQFQASPYTTIVIPVHEGSVAELGVPVTSDYFGSIPADRLVTKVNATYMRADAEYRGKLGINPARGKGVLGSYDADHHVLTIVQHTLPRPGADFVNNTWKIQDEPFKGDMTNAYNDGPSADGARLGHFYEMESVSPAMQLGPGQSTEHMQRTIHLEGTEQELDQIARAVLGVSIEEIRSALPSVAAKASTDQSR